MQLAGFPAWSKHKGSRGDLAWEILRRRYYIFGLLLQPKVRRTEKYNFPAHCIPNKCHESGWIGITLNAEVMSIFASQAPRPAILINSTACSMSWYLRENSSRGIKLLILGTVEYWGEDDD